ncbi:uncharacterized protein HMPREF1541_04212 [Cyphellophora europaea CBS 101466]|uniref:Anaphase-promoting complex subunit 4 WD40 domain-containing protein n=1 Tax=Cyphellophora europaea (strain CBS 101466) TaxID=1220924 RepID=W2S0L8_CYPE1|nr:uncharacterized protein HMPREF1541_04212 [Cyphellophora europaea CBS 101466]ETN42271.1 hypothetical protein HMPREF1541_04212 [Cyphellophora europaea CBS 101466]
MQVKCVGASPADHNSGSNGFKFRSSRQSYRNLQWSADGTCLLATSYNHSIDTYVVTVNLLEERDLPHRLDAYSSLTSPDPVNAVIGYPFFSLQDPTSTLLLSSQRHHPVRLCSALTGERVASYAIINTLTEEYICPNSLVFSSTGQHFIAGSESLISIFDISSPGQEPLATVQTGPKRVKDDRWNPSTSIRGIVSSLAIEPSSKVLAAGTFTRQIGLYEAEGQGSCIGAFTVTGNDADTNIGGGGITQLNWSPCGRYLYIAERKSDGIMLYDIRQTGQLLSWCEGRNANTNQRLGFDITTNGESSHEVWAGGKDGVVRIWKDVHMSEGGVAATFCLDAHDGNIPAFVRDSQLIKLQTPSLELLFTDLEALLQHALARTTSRRKRSRQPGMEAPLNLLARSRSGHC